MSPSTKPGYGGLYLLTPELEAGLAAAKRADDPALINEITAIITEKVMSAIDKLPRRQRVYLLSYLETGSYTQTAALYRVNRRTVWRQINGYDKEQKLGAVERIRRLLSTDKEIKTLLAWLVEAKSEEN